MRLAGVLHLCGIFDVHPHSYCVAFAGFFTVSQRCLRQYSVVYVSSCLRAPAIGNVSEAEDVKLGQAHRCVLAWLCEA